MHEASLLYVSNYMMTLLQKLTNVLHQPVQKAYPNLYGLKAYSYDKMGDSLNAKKYFEEFFAKVNPDKIGPNDYATYGKILIEIPWQRFLASIYVDKAVRLDTVPANK